MLSAKTSSAMTNPTNLRDTVAQASQWVDACESLFSTDSILKPSGFWAEHTQKLRQWLTESQDPTEMFRQQIENNGFTYPRRNDDPAFKKVAASYMAWLDRQGYPLKSLPFELQESPMTREHMCTIMDNRKVSVMFFWHLCALIRMDQWMPTTPKTVLEIGGGYGGLARLAKHYWPNCKYMILDLPMSLLYSYLYIAQHFPNAKLLWVTNAAQLAEAKTGGYDFVFIPCSLENALRDQLQCDLLVNTASLGEMSQEAASWYINLIENHMDVGYFFFVNRYGHNGAGHLSHNCCVHFDSRWRMHTIAIDNKDTINRLDDYFPRHLEFFAERLPESAISPDTNRMIAEQLLAQAQALKQQDNAFDVLAYESARIYPMESNIKLYLAYLQKKGFFEEGYFRQHFTARAQS